jgi:hypothetical protein
MTLFKECPECEATHPLYIMPTSAPQVHTTLVSHLATDGELQLGSFSAAEYEAEIAGLDYIDSEDEDEDINEGRFGSIDEQRFAHGGSCGKAELKLEVEGADSVAPISPTSKGHLKSAVERLFQVQNEATKVIPQTKKRSNINNQVSHTSSYNTTRSGGSETKRNSEDEHETTWMAKRENQERIVKAHELVLEKKNRLAATNDEGNKKTSDAGNVSIQLPQTVSDSTTARNRVLTKSDSGAVKAIIAKLEAASL